MLSNTFKINRNKGMQNTWILFKYSDDNIKSVSVWKNNRHVLWLHEEMSWEVLPVCWLAFVFNTQEF